MDEIPTVQFQKDGDPVVPDIEETWYKNGHKARA